MCDDVFEWEVELPERTAAPLGGRRPLAQVKFSSDGHDGQWSVPLAVGRSLSKKAKLGSSVGSRAELAYLVKETSFTVGKKRVEDMLNRRDYSSQELYDRLHRDGYSESSAKRLVEYAESCGYVRDSRFADVFIRSKVSLGWGRNRIERELTRKGIDVSSIVGWPEDYLSADDERERAYELASRRRLTGKNDYQKIVRYLCSRGYSMSVAIDAAKNALADTETDV